MKTLRRITRVAHDTWLGSYIGDEVVVAKYKNGNVVLWLDGSRYDDCKDYLRCLSKPIKNIPLISTRMPWWWQKEWGDRKEFMKQDWMKRILKVNRQRIECKHNYYKTIKTSTWNLSFTTPPTKK